MNSRTDRPNEDWLEDMLRDDARLHIDDDGFTDRVMAVLPEYRQSSLFRLRHFWPVAMTLIACVFVFILMPGSQLVYQALTDLVSLRGTPPASLAIAVTLGLLYWLGIAGALDES